MRKKPKLASSNTPYQMTSILDDLEKVVKIQSVTLSNEARASTGLFCLDLLLGRGGITAGFYVFSGAEQSAKTTIAITILAASVSQEVGLRVLWDAENSSGSSADYVENIFHSTGVVNTSASDIFGVKKDNQYIIEPMVYYRDEGSMSTFFDWTAGFLRRLPDKRYEDGKWWFVYEADRDTKAKYKDVMDRKKSASSGAIYIPAENGSLQSIILVDSLPSLLPDAMDEDDPKSGMALQAREFAKHLPRIKGKLRAKRVAVIAINQIREKIGFVMGDPRYEPGGNAIKYFSDVRIWNTPRALSSVPFNPKGKGQIEKEESIDGGEDTYRYVHLKAIKNKLATPGGETWARIWVSDSSGQAHGFCPVWDAFYTMAQCGMLSGKRSAISLNIPGLGPAKRTLNWLDFKKLILGDEATREEICTRIGYRKLDLRKGLAKMAADGRLESIYLEKARAKGAKAVGVDDDEEESDADEV